MSNSDSLLEEVIERNPQEKHLSDYRPSDYTISTIDLEFDLFDHQTKVQAISQVQRVSKEVTPLFLFGEALNLVSILVDGVNYVDFELVEDGIVINHLPASFKLEINTEIDPAKNHAFEGLYKSGEAFCTQCEAEGFRRITYYLDRPDVLAKFSTKVIADKALYPYLLSNGNQVDQGDLDSGRHFVKWVDPFPKPAYLFALVAGDFDLVEDNFMTKSGRDVKLAIFVDKGNLDKTQHAMLSLKKSMQWDEERFNLEYDLDIYMIVAVDFSIWARWKIKG